MKSWMKAKIINLDEVDSTNSYCKRAADDGYRGDLIVCAAHQTGGRGTKGRSFLSDEGGLYLSAMRFLRGFDFSNTFSIMINSCVAVCKALETAGLCPTIKWANDVLVGGKKISGTLIENKLLAGGEMLNIVGIGINVNNALPPCISDIATSVKEQIGRSYPLEKLKRALIKTLGCEYTVDEYKRYVDWLGREVKISSGGGEFSAVAKDIGEDGSLIVEREGGTVKINSAEMSLKL